MRKWILWVVLAVCCLTGCGRKQPEVVGSAESSEEPKKDYVAEYQAQTAVDPFAVKWCVQDTENSEVFYRQETYRAPLFENKAKTGEGYTTWRIDGYGCCDAYFHGYSESYEYKTTRYFVDKLNLETLEVETYEYLPVENNSPCYLTYTGEKLYGIFEGFDEDGFVNRVTLTELLPDGSYGESIEIGDFAIEKGLTPKEDHFLFQFDLHYCRSKKVIYFIPFDKTGFYVLGEDGTLQYEFSGFGAEGDSEFSFYAITDNGDAIFLAYDKTSRESSFFIYENQSVKKLHTEQGQIDFVVQDFASVDAFGNVVYLEKRNNIVRWNLETGKRERLYCGTKSMDDLQFMACTKEGKILLVTDDIEGMSLSLYSASGPAQTVELKLETASGFYSYDLKTKIETFEKTHPGVTIKLGKALDNFNDRDIHLNQIYQDIIDDKGPDLILMETQDMQRFVENGALMDMSGVIDEKAECILPGLMKNGQVDGKQYLFPQNAYISTALVNKSVWDKPTWTVEEALDTLEQFEKEHPKECHLYSGFSGYSTGLGALDYFISDLEHGPFVDMASRTCSFDGELFRRVLELCKKYDERTTGESSNYVNQNAQITQFKEGNTLFTIPFSQDFGAFSSYQARLEDDCNWVGYPTDSASGNTIRGGMCIAVSSKTQHREIIEEMLRCFYSFDYLMEFAGWQTPIRTDILEKNVIEDCNWSSEIQVRTGRRTYVPISGKKKDGTSYINEYIQFLLSCKSTDPYFDALISIIEEEAEPYFENQKSVSEVQKLIQNRVMLYINE